jgi:hypothetical protein
VPALPIPAWQNDRFDKHSGMLGARTAVRTRANHTFFPGSPSRIADPKVVPRHSGATRSRRSRTPDSSVIPVCHPDSATRTFCTPPLLSRRVPRGQSERVTESAWRAHRADVIADGRFRFVPGGVTSPPEGLLPELVRSATRVRE